MLVKFKTTWFAPGGEYVKEGRIFSGQRYKKGVTYDLPDELVSCLPSDALIEVLDKGYVRPEPAVQKEMTLSDYDTSRKAAGDEIRLRKELSEEDKEKKRQQLAKARETRLAKLEEQKKTKEKEAA